MAGEELIIVGASARAAAFSAIRAGFQPYAIDQFADRDLAAAGEAVRVNDYPHDFLAALRAAPSAPWIYTGGLENYPRLVDHLARIRPLWGNAGQTLRQVRDPFLLCQTVREAGFEMPAMRRELTADERATWDTWLRKPYRGSGGRSIAVAGQGRQPPRRSYFYQRFIPGRAWGAIFVALPSECRLLGVTAQVAGPAGEFAYRGSIVAPENFPLDESPLTHLGERLSDRFELRGLFNVDFVGTDERDYVLEVNPRYSASVEVLERATGINCMALHAAAWCRMTNDQAPMTKDTVGDCRSLPTRAVGKQIVYAEADGIIPDSLNEIIAEWNRDPAQPMIADLPHSGDAIRRGQPICSIFAEGESQEEVEQQLRVRAHHVQQVIARAVQ